MVEPCGGHVCGTRLEEVEASLAECQWLLWRCQQIIDDRAFDDPVWSVYLNDQVDAALSSAADTLWNRACFVCGGTGADDEHSLCPACRGTGLAEQT